MTTRTYSPPSITPNKALKQQSHSTVLTGMFRTDSVKISEFVREKLFQAHPYPKLMLKRRFQTLFGARHQTLAIPKKEKKSFPDIGLIPSKNLHLLF